MALQMAKILLIFRTKVASTVQTFLPEKHFLLSLQILAQ